MKFYAALIASLAALPLASAVELPPSARGAAAEEGGQYRVEAELQIDRAVIVPGEPFRIGVRFELDPQWHIYWRNPGQAAYSTEVAFEGSGVEFGELQWPGPSVFTAGDGFITTYGYSEETLLFATATLTDAAADHVALGAVADFLVCKIDCIPGRIELHREVAVSPVAEPAPSEVIALFDQYAAMVPRTAEELGWTIEVAIEHQPVRAGDELDAVIAVAACSDEAEGVVCRGLRPSGTEPREFFVPDVMPQLEVQVVGAEPHPTAPDGAILRLRLQGGPDAVDAEQRFRGVLRIEDAAGRSFFVLADESLTRGPAGAAVVASASPLLAGRVGGDPGAAAAVATRAPTMSVWHALWLALIGGLLLNLMPCVLPVLALKAASLAQLAHRSARHRAAHAAGYAAGVVGSMLVLAVAVIALRMAGSGIGWGFQFQNPVFVAAVVVICVVFALELFGVFEIGVNATALDEASQRASGVRRSVFEGVLAVVLATPCSAPFMAGAIGFALAAPSIVVLGVFTLLGVGLAAPYVVLAMTPGAARLIPQPGAWMDDLKRALGFVMLGAALWLMQAALGVGGEQALWRIGLVALVASAAAWAWGETQRRRPERATIVLSAGLVVVGVAAALFWRFDPPSDREVQSDADSGVVWRPYSEQALASELGAGRVVFVDYTADWCITCKFNERTVLNVDPVATAFRELTVTTLRADWTRHDAAIAADLARFGKAGVPMYLLYSPDDPTNPRVLPELLTSTLVVEALHAAAGDTDPTPEEAEP